MRRVVVTGMGIVSSIGNTTQEVLASLREARSGVVHAQDYARYGFRCQVHGSPDINVEELVDRRAMRFHGKGTAWNHVAMDQAIRDAGLEESEISNERTGIIMGSGRCNLNLRRFYVAGAAGFNRKRTTGFASAGDFF